MKLTSLYSNRLLLVMAAIVITFMLVACTATSTPSATTSTPSTATPNATRTRPAFTRSPAAPSPTTTELPSPTAATPVTPISPTVTSSPTLIPTSSTYPTASGLPFPTSTGFYPLVSITIPGYASTIPTGDVPVSVQVSNFKLVDKEGLAAVSGEGHIIYYMDVTPPVVQGQAAITAAGTYAASANISYTWHAVAPGVHLFSVQLVNNDDTPLSPTETFTEYVNVH